eukprot:3085548-Pyramimonas_sp.AAC.1
MRNNPDGGKSRICERSRVWKMHRVLPRPVQSVPEGSGSVPDSSGAVHPHLTPVGRRAEEA